MTLTVLTAPKVTTSPRSVKAGQRSVATFKATASGNPAPTVQWQVSADRGRHWANIASATSTSLRITAAHIYNGRQYRAVFHNVVGTAGSTVATLTVTR